jgi:NAD(P)H-hydrate epimerase
MLTGSEMAVVDANAAALGVPRKQLMESSGHAIGRTVRDHADTGDSVTLVAGRGNNGGDALVAARFLDGYDLRICLLGRRETITTDIARDNWDALCSAQYPTEKIRDSAEFALADPDLIVDAMVGTGITGSLREPAASAAAAINDSDATVLSVDVPSGLDAESGTLASNAVDPDHVVTFHDTKPGLDRDEWTVTVADIGIPDAAERFVERGDLQRLNRDPSSHKGDQGEVLVVGGGPYTGAPSLAAQAALRAGADLVHVATPESVAATVQGYSENIIVHEYAGNQFTTDHTDALLDLAAPMDAIVVGPGLGDAEKTMRAIETVLSEYDGTAVVDADGLSVVPGIDTDADVLCTPHQGELRAMGGETSDEWRERADLVESFATELGHTLLVKGPADVISDGDRTRINHTGNAGMTVGGTGDVLAGVAGAVACRQPLAHAGAIAAYATGTAGDRVADERGDGLVATDLLDELPAVLYR